MRPGFRDTCTALVSAKTQKWKLEVRLSPQPHCRLHRQPLRGYKSALTLSEPKRRRDKSHLRFVAAQACSVCGRQPSDPHHLRFAQPRALGLKVSDEFTVPLCRGHHRQLHQAGNEIAWWDKIKIDALGIARKLWEETHPDEATSGDETSATSKTE
jgi:hypothetical protein